MTQADSFKNGTLAAEAALWSIYLATAGNAFFKTVLASTSRRPGFSLRIAAGFLLMLAAGGAVLVWT